MTVRNAASFTETRYRLRGRALFVRAGVSDDAMVAALVERTVTEFGGLDLAYNNAGIEGTPAPMAECTPENWQRKKDWRWPRPRRPSTAS